MRNAEGGESLIFAGFDGKEIHCFAALCASRVTAFNLPRKFL